MRLGAQSTVRRELMDGPESGRHPMKGVTRRFSLLGTTRVDDRRGWDGTQFMGTQMSTDARAPRVSGGIHSAACEVQCPVFAKEPMGLCSV